MARRRPRHAARSKAPFSILLLAMVAIAGAVTLWQTWGSDGDARAGGSDPSVRPTVSASPSMGASPSAGTTGPTGTPSPSGAQTPGPINTEFPGITTFRGNATRDYYGEGPVPMHPVIRWNYPESGGLCSTSADAAGSRLWCGTGWTGQPNVIVHEGGRIEIREGAYDGRYHFLNGRTGRIGRPGRPLRKWYRPSYAPSRISILPSWCTITFGCPVHPVPHQTREPAASADVEQSAPLSG